MRKLYSVLALAVVLFLHFQVKIDASNIQNERPKGSITVQFELPDGLYSYGSLMLKKVADLQIDNGIPSWKPIDAIAGGNFDFSDIYVPDLATKLDLYSHQVQLPETLKEVTNNGGVKCAVFDDMEEGLYLAVQYQAASDYYPCAPFLISIPYIVGENYVYDVDASAKTSLSPIPSDPPPTPTPPPTPPDLPQTGQMNWPIPVLACTGLSMIIVGWILRFRKREHDEA